jgi:NADH:ubiquinone oxidoreductase subunit F (NADH-binding)
MTIPPITLFSGTLSLPTIINNLVTIALYLAAVTAVGFLIYGGILFMVSSGDADKTTKARNTILYAVVGVIVVALSFAILAWANSLGSSGIKTP